MGAQALASADAAWLHMDEPDNRMQIVALFRFDRAPDRDRLREVVRSGLLRYARFRMRVRDDGRHPPAWEPDPDFDLDRHLVVEPPGDLFAFVGRAMEQPFDPGHPLWSLHLVGPDLVVRIHHCMADGIALVRVLLNMADGLGPAVEVHAAPTGVPEHARFLHDPRELLLHPGDVLDLAWKGAAALTKLALLPPDPRTPLKGPLGDLKSAAVSAPLALDSMKSVARAHGGTVNDVLMATLSGALGRWLGRRIRVARDLEIRAVVPVDLRPQGQDPELGNRFGLVFLPLPVGIPDPDERLRRVHEAMERLKRSPQAVVVFGLLTAVGHLPTDFQRTIVEIFGTKASAVVTNLPGPDAPLALAGERIRSFMFWVPRSGRLGLGLSLLSYAGQVRLGIAADRRRMGDPDALVGDFLDCAEELGVLRAEQPHLGLEALAEAGAHDVAQVVDRAVAHGVEGRVAGLPPRHEPGLLQDLEVLADVGLGRADPAAQFRDAALSLLEAHEDAEAVGLGQGPEAGRDHLQGLGGRDRGHEA